MPLKAPNGYGTVVRLKGNRRRPYVVRKTAGWDGDRRIIKAVGYYPTREEAMLALAEYNKSPYDINGRKITMAELFARWRERAVTQGRLAPKTIDNLTSKYKCHCYPLADTPYVAIRAHMMQECVNASPPTVQNLVKNLFYQLDRYAAELDIIDKRYSNLVSVAATSAKQRNIFSDAEVARLWDNVAVPWVDTVLILLFSGWRISEFLSLQKGNIHIDPTGKTVNTMQGGVKTKAGKERIVPIHSAILPFVEARYNRAEKYLVECGRGKMVSATQYYRYWYKVMELIDARHIVHETRHTFRSWLDNANANIACANRIMGHVCHDFGLQTYTHKALEQLAATVELIKSEHSATVSNT